VEKLKRERKNKISLVTFLVEMKLTKTEAKQKFVSPIVSPSKTKPLQSIDIQGF
jgi:hypothetical protein